MTKNNKSIKRRKFFKNMVNLDFSRSMDCVCGVNQLTDDEIIELSKITSIDPGSIALSVHNITGMNLRVDDLYSFCTEVLRRIEEVKNGDDGGPNYLLEHDAF